ncbi:MAG: hypothetical protein JSS79_16570 [Bacteroidetes bacterium]|nr:hypothetical protein [Bacteroidota bacterium]
MTGYFKRSCETPLTGFAGTRYVVRQFTKGNDLVKEVEIKQEICLHLEVGQGVGDSKNSEKKVAGHV